MSEILVKKVNRLRVGWLNRVCERGAARAEDAQGTPTQSLISPSIQRILKRTIQNLSNLALFARKRLRKGLHRNGPPPEPAYSRPPFGHSRLLFLKSHDRKGANGLKKRPHDAYPVRCRVPGYYEPCSEMVRFCQIQKYRRLMKSGPGTARARRRSPRTRG